ncbi:hypothetical protein BGZ83_002032 [Gryganskiella cystojenkinii]|nr:hypothetical protein BGZ83_002032 [Gryganskiella cystojenkinii]
MEEFDRRFSVDIISLDNRTRKEAVQIACEQYGDVDRVIMGKNVKGSMATATVTFAAVEAVDAMQKANSGMFLVGMDSGQIKRCGLITIDHNNRPKQKLVNLPRYYTPRHVAALFDTADKKYRVFTITMPVNVRYNTRQPEAFVTFENDSDWEAVRYTNFEVGRVDPTSWIDTKDKACHTCGSTVHIQRNCEAFKRHKEVMHQREVNDFYSNPKNHDKSFPALENKNKEKSHTVLPPNARGGMNYAEKATESITKSNTKPRYNGNTSAAAGAPPKHTKNPDIIPSTPLTQQKGSIESSDMRATIARQDAEMRDLRQLVESLKRDMREVLAAVRATSTPKQLQPFHPFLE